MINEMHTHELLEITTQNSKEGLSCTLYLSIIHEMPLEKVNF